MNWVLILVMMQAGYAGGSVEAIRFETKEVCLAVGDLFIRYDENHRAICMEDKNGENE